jgi:hypothetical protein
MTVHAKLSPSSADRWMTCPGSVLESEKVSPKPSSVFAREGSLIHWAAEQVLNNIKKGKIEISGIEDSLEIMVGTYNPEFDMEIDRDITWAAGYYLDFLVPYISNPDTDWGVELKVTLKTPTKETIFGTSDFVAYDKVNDKLTVIDLKGGRGVSVSAENNTQLMIYALGVIDYVKQDLISEDTTVDLWIVQPRDKDGDCESLYETNVAELNQFRNEVLIPAIKRIEAKDCTLVPSEKGCRWCPASAHCEALGVEVIKSAQQTFDDVDREELARKLKKALDVVDWVETWCKNVRQTALNEMQNGLDIEGYKLVESKKRRVWFNEDDVIDFMDDHKIDAEIYTPRKLFSPAQALKLKALKNNEELLKLINKPQGAPTLAPASDKRPALETFGVWDE